MTFFYVVYLSANRNPFWFTAYPGIFLASSSCWTLFCLSGDDNDSPLSSSLLEVATRPALPDLLLQSNYKGIPM